MTVHNKPQYFRSLFHRKVIAILCVNACGALLLLSLFWFLAHTLGAAGLGAYNFAWALVEVAAVVAVLGFDKLLMRRVAEYATLRSMGLLRGLIRTAGQFIVATSLLLGAVAVAIILFMQSWIEADLVLCAVVGMCILPFRSLTMGAYGALLGLHKTVLAQIALIVAHPLLTLTALIILFLFAGDLLNAPVAVACSLGGAILVSAFIALMLHRQLHAVIGSATPKYQVGQWTRSALPMMLIASMSLVNIRADIVMLGAIKGAEAAGVYSAASRIAELIRFGALAVNPSLVGMIASLHVAHDWQGLRDVIRSSSRFLLLWGVLAMIVLVVGGLWFLRIFGQTFAAGYWPLVILGAGQVITVGLGAVDTILLMTGHERDALKGFVAATLVNLLLNALLIPQWGLLGAAVATAISAAVWSVLLATYVYRRLRINPTAFGYRGERP